MPAFVKTAEDERLWSKAKKLAKQQGRGDDYAYINGIFQKMTKSEIPTKSLADLLACVRRAYELAHSFHWRTSGPSFAGDHELFAKVYGQLYGHIDPLAEKIVGGGGEALVEAGKQAKQTAAEHEAPVSDPAKFPAEMARTVGDLLDEIREAIASNDDDGVENMLQGMVDEIQTLEYLLKQRASMTKSDRNGLTLDLNKSIGLLRGGGVGEEPRWRRFPGAASMFNARDEAAQETKRLMSEMPTQKLAISDGNFTSPDDVVKGLGFAPTDEIIWAHRVARMVQRAPSEMALRKAIAGDLRGEQLEPTLRAEMNRRILSLYRQSNGGKPLEKAFPPKKGAPPPKGGKGKPPMMGGDDDKAQPGAPGKAPTMAPGAKPGGAPGRAPTMAPPPPGGQPGADPGAAGRNPAVDVADLHEQPDDVQLLRHKLHALHEDLKASQGPITGNAALIHLHNDLKAQMRDAYKDPHPEVVNDIAHKIHHFTKMLEGPEQPDPNDPNAQQPGQPGPQGQPQPNAVAGKPPMGGPPGAPPRTPGKRPPGPPMMKSSHMQGAPTPALGQAAKGTPTEGRGYAMKPKGQQVVAGKKSAASSTIKHKKPKGLRGMKGMGRAAGA